MGGARVCCRMPYLLLDALLDSCSWVGSRKRKATPAVQPTAVQANAVRRRRRKRGSAAPRPDLTMPDVLQEVGISGANATSLDPDASDIGEQTGRSAPVADVAQGERPNDTNPGGRASQSGQSMQPVSAAESAPNVQQPAAHSGGGLSQTKADVQGLLQNVFAKDIPPEELQEMFGNDLSTLLHLRHHIDRQISHYTASQSAANTLSDMACQGSPPEDTHTAATPTPSTSEQIRKVHSNLTCKLNQCTQILINMHQTPSTQTRTAAVANIDARRILHAEATALIETCQNEQQQEDELLLSQYGTATVPSCKIKRCCACDTAPIKNIILPCGHGLCSQPLCANVGKCPLCGDERQVHSVTQLHIFEAEPAFTYGSI